jgi:hypothetical protein
MAAYSTALAELHNCAFVHASDDWDAAMAQSVAAALAASKLIVDPNQRVAGSPGVTSRNRSK